MSDIRKIAIIGGTGKEGKGLAYRWCRVGYKIIIGSRQLEKAQAAAEEIRKMLVDNERISGTTNDLAAQDGDIIVVTVPFSVHSDMMKFLKPFARGKIVIDVTVPLVPPKVSQVQIPPAGSAAQEAQLILGEEVSVVSAFQNISYERLLTDEPVDCDVLVTGKGKDARNVVLGLIRDAGMVGWDAGPIENAIVAEGLTSILIHINKQFDIHNSGIKITGVPVKR